MAVGLKFDVTAIPSARIVAGQLSRFAGDIRSLREPLELAVDKVIRPRIRDNFEEERAAGIGWEPLADRTISNRERLGYGAGPILQRTGKLADVAQQKQIWTFDGQAGEAFVESLPNEVQYGHLHQERTRHMPARPFFVIDETDEEKIAKVFDSWLADRIERIA